MKLRHLLMTIAFTLIIGLSMGCDFSEDDPGGNGNGGNGGSGSNNDPFTVKDAAGWERALKVIQEGGNNKNYTITVTGDFSVPGKGESVLIFFGHNSGITVTIQGNGTISLSSAGSLLYTYYTTQTVIVKDLTLRGYAANNAAVVHWSGNFRMEGNATVTGNTGGPGVQVNDGGFFTMQDNASVTNNSSSNGGVYVSNATFTMKGNASVSSNTSGGGVGTFVGTVVMQDNASVKNNISNIYGGGVGIRGGTFTMQDNALVSGNTAPSGGGVSVDGTFTMQNNATVSGNTANAGDGGGVLVGANPNNSFNMQGGTISGNTASVDGGGVCVGWSAVFTKTGGTIYGSDTSASQRNTASGKGHAAVNDPSSEYGKKRDTTAGPGDNMSQDFFSASFGWDE